METSKICKKCVFPKSREYIAIPYQATSSGRIGVFRKHTNYPQSSFYCSRRLPLPLHRRALLIINESLNTNHFSSSFHFVGVQDTTRTDCPGLAWSGTHLGIYGTIGVGIMMAGCSGKTRRKSSYGLPCGWERESIMKIERNGIYVL